jgi:preprotein translocase subunit SecE
MKKPKGKEKKSSIQNQGANAMAPPLETNSESGPVREEKEDKKRSKMVVAKKEADKRGEEKSSVFKYAQVAAQFLREARMELKKVKWPTRKEMLASTGVVIALVIIVSFFLGLIDLGLIKIIKSMVG